MLLLDTSPLKDFSPFLTYSNPTHPSAWTHVPPLFMKPFQISGVGSSVPWTLIIHGPFSNYTFLCKILLWSFQVFMSSGKLDWKFSENTWVIFYVICSVYCASVINMLKDEKEPEEQTTKLLPWLPRSGDDLWGVSYICLIILREGNGLTWAPKDLFWYEDTVQILEESTCRGALMWFWHNASSSSRAPILPCTLILHPCEASAVMLRFVHVPAGADALPLAFW